MLCQPMANTTVFVAPSPLPSGTHTVHGLVSKLCGSDESWTREYFEDLNGNCSALCGIWHVPLVSQENSSLRKNNVRTQSVFLVPEQLSLNLWGKKLTWISDAFTSSFCLKLLSQNVCQCHGEDCLDILNLWSLVPLCFFVFEGNLELDWKENCYQCCLSCSLLLCQELIDQTDTEQNPHCCCHVRTP